MGATTKTTARAGRPAGAAARRWRAVGRLAALAAVAGLVPGSFPAPAAAQVFMTQQEALGLAFADAEVERRTAFLSEEELGRAGALAGEDVEVEQRVVNHYVATRECRPVGVAYFDAHRVRTLEEVVMVVVTPDGRIERIEVLRFSEPPEYRVPEGWIDQLDGKGLSGELSLKGGIVNMTGATLTSRAVVGAARRVLALHAVIAPFAGGAC